MAGADLRLTVLCVPPLIPLIHRDLAMNEKAIGVLTGMTPFMLALFAIPGSLLIARLGARRALISGLVLMAAAGALRGLGPTVGLLLAMTFLMALGIAVIQPAFPSLARQWHPQGIGLATATYANGLLMGEIIAAALTLPLVLPLTGGRWEIALAAWSLPVLLTAAVVAVATPHVARDAAHPPARWWPDWRDRQVWLLGLIFGSASAIYWGSNAFIPDYLHATGRSGLVPAAITALNAGQIPASILIGAGSRRVIGRRWPFLLAGALGLLALAGFLDLPSDAATVAAAALFGFMAAGVLVLTLALPPLMAARDDEHRLSAGIFTITYACSFLGPLLGGAVWDATGRAPLAFAPVGVASALILGLSLLLRVPRPAAAPESARAAA
ncbi:MAG: MFS transporter [Chloroflexi bacterium]|nr:MAG: MFS transporter [Chloroflexota bacterium]